MLKKVTSSFIENLDQSTFNVNLVGANAPDSDEGEKILEKHFSNYEKVTIDQPFQIFNDKVLANKSNPDLDVKKGGVDYGVLSLLEGDWYSYIEDESKRVSNIKDGEFKPNLGSGIHTTIMPSPGTTQNNIPGKFSFECDEYIEKLSFNRVKGGVRNRGGANEQFCGAVKYEQSIKSLNIDPNKIFEKEDIQTILSILVNEDERKKTLSEYLKSNKYFEKIFDNINKDGNANAYKDKPVKEVINDFLILFNGIHEENGMYLWLSDILKNPATEKSIAKDRGVHNWNNEEGKSVLFKRLYGTDEKISALQNELISTNDKKRKEEIEKLIDALEKAKLAQNTELSSIVNDHPFLDVTLYNVGTLTTPKYTTDLKDGDTIISIVPAKELQPGEGIDRPTFVPDYSISRSGVIPHGSTITLLGDLKREAGSYLINGEPLFVNPSIGTWDEEHLALSDTMGTGISPTNPTRPFDLYNPPLPFTPTADFNQKNDPGEQEVYTQQLFLHNLYPYSLRPDLRLRDSIKNQNIKNHIKVVMFSKNDEGAQGGIVNIPFVNRFVPTVNMKMNMWLETVVENGKEILQLQYEQIVFFEFGFGDGGGTTSWPHIQVNTLRQAKDLNEYSRKLAVKQFDLKVDNEKSQNNFQEKNGNKIANSDSTSSNDANDGTTVDISKCPFHNSKK